MAIRVPIPIRVPTASRALTVSGVPATSRFRTVSPARMVGPATVSPATVSPAITAMVGRLCQPVAGEHHPRRPVLRGLLGDGLRVEPGARQQPEPDLAAEQPGAVRLLDHAH